VSFRCLETAFPKHLLIPSFTSNDTTGTSAPPQAAVIELGVIPAGATMGFKVMNTGVNNAAAEMAT
jgi:hypothetical protein